MVLNCLSTIIRYKVHVQVMDATGSTTFILFDRNAQTYVGRSVHDLIDAPSQVILNVHTM